MQPKTAKLLEQPHSLQVATQLLLPGDCIRFRATGRKDEVERLHLLGLVPTRIGRLRDWPKRVLGRAFGMEATKPMDRQDCQIKGEEEALIHALEEHGRITFRARGGSMRPVIPDDSLVEVHSFLEGVEPRVGQIILVAQPERTVLHRLVDIIDTSRGRAFLCRGDRVQHYDRPVWRDAVLGIYSGTGK
jgi:hypothetical protein